MDINVCNIQRWANLLTQQTSIAFYRLPIKENKLPFPLPIAANKRKFAVSIFHLQQTNGSRRFPLVRFSVYIYIIDGQVRLVHFQKDNFCLFFRKHSDKRQNFRLHDEQTVNGLRKIAWASVFRLKLQHIQCIDIY
jgi:hypothetical protein